MKLRVDDGRGFDPLDEVDSLAPLDHIWAKRRIPRKWLAEYRKPIVILMNSFSITSLEDYFGDEIRSGGSSRKDLADWIVEVVRDCFGFRPDLPLPSFKPEFGGLTDLRRGRGDFIACRCNGCGQVHPAYWIETQADAERANAIIRRHPAIPFMPSVGVVTFRGREFVGCHCFSAWCREKRDAEFRRDEWHMIA